MSVGSPIRTHVRLHRIFRYLGMLEMSYGFLFKVLLR